MTVSQRCDHCGYDVIDAPYCGRCGAPVHTAPSASVAHNGAVSSFAAPAARTESFTDQIDMPEHTILRSSKPAPQPSPSSVPSWSTSTPQSPEPPQVGSALPIDPRPTSSLVQQQVRPSSALSPHPWRPAGKGARLGAAILDSLVIIAINLTGQVIPVHDLWYTVSITVSAVLSLMYLAVFMGRGRTMGKRLVGIHIVDYRTGETIGFGRGLMRSVLWLLMWVPLGLGFLSVFGRESRGWHDRVVGSVVAIDESTLRPIPQF